MSAGSAGRLSGRPGNDPIAHVTATAADARRRVTFARREGLAVTRRIDRWVKHFRAPPPIRAAKLFEIGPESQFELLSAQNQTAETLALLETLQANAPVGFGFIDRDFRRVRVNETLAGFNGSTVAEQVGRTMAELVPQFWSQLEPLYRSVLETEVPILNVEVSGPSWDDPKQMRYFSNSYYPVTVDDRVIGIGIVAVEVTERHKAEQVHRQMSAIVEGSADAIIGCGLDGMITTWNAAAERLFGYTAQETIGGPATVIAPGDLKHEQDQIRSKITLDGLSERYETQRQRKDGSRVEVLITSSAVTDASGAVTSLSVFIQDITARKTAEAAMRSARLDAERANTAKNEFLSRMSHELRTPMNAVLGFGQLLEMDKANLSEPQHEAIGHILSGGRHLLSMIDDVLDISRIETDQFDISLEPVHVAGLLQEAVDMSAISARAAGIDLHYSQPKSPADGDYVRADRRRLLQVILNLVSNAIKYNATGGRVSVSAKVGKGSVRMVIADTGIGIRTQDLPRLFTPFDRLGQQVTAIPGTGIGLALTQRLVAIMGGELLVDSTFGTGSTFSVVLPVAVPPVGSERVMGTYEGVPELIEPSASTSSVLYIEDNRPNVALMERVVQRRPGWVLSHAETGGIGLDMARSGHPTLVLLDLHLPDMNGIDVLHALRADPATAPIPIVVLSADASPQEIARLYAAGANGYRTKPLNISEILHDLDEYETPADAEAYDDQTGVKETAEAPAW